MAKLKFMWSSTSGTEYELTGSTSVTANITVQTWYVGDYSCGASGDILGYDWAFWASSGTLHVGLLSEGYDVIEVYATDSSGRRATSYTINGDTITSGSGGSGSGGGSTTEYTVSYNANGGTGAPGAQITSGGEVTLSTQVPTRSGYTFLGWSRSSGATSASYYAGYTYALSTNITLYAVWRSNSGGGTSGTVTSTFPTASGKYYLCIDGKRIKATKDGVTYYLYIQI